MVHIIFQGPSGSGKTHSAKRRLIGPRVIVSRDDYRKLFKKFYDLKGWYLDYKWMENEITYLVKSHVEQAISSGCPVILDGTHLKDYYVEEWKGFIKKFDPEATFNIIDYRYFNNIVECLERNRNRKEEERVKDEVIHRQLLTIHGWK